MGTQLWRRGLHPRGLTEDMRLRTRVFGNDRVVHKDRSPECCRPSGNLRKRLECLVAPQSQVRPGREADRPSTAMTQFWLCPERLSDSNPARDSPEWPQTQKVSRQGVLRAKNDCQWCRAGGQIVGIGRVFVGLPAAGELRLKRAIPKVGRRFHHRHDHDNLDNNPRISRFSTGTGYRVFFSGTMLGCRFCLPCCCTSFLGLGEGLVQVKESTAAS